MDWALQIGSVLLGVVALFYGAEWLVRGSSSIALKMGISPLVIGLTIVALGTSCPELIVCIGLNLSGNPDTAVGNIVGSNICNIALVLGVSALVRPIVIKAQLLKRDTPLLIGFTLLFIWMLSDGELEMREGVVLLSLIVLYLLVIFRLAKAETDPDILEEFEEEIGTAAEARRRSSALMVLMIVMGVAVLVVGAEFLKTGALAIATRIGVSDAVIGLTLVAVGTSLPELATSFVAAARNEGDLLIGNVIGSSIFNICAIMGITILVKNPMVITEILPGGLAVMFGSAVLVLPLMWTRRRLSRTEGLILLVGYLVYTGYLFTRA
ncbi:MAG: calcium/sodium antiporter [Verrucomicrobiales bacterium]